MRLILVAQGNLANTYRALGRLEDAMRLRREVYSGRVKLSGEEHEQTLIAANNYANLLVCLQRFEEAKSLMRKTGPVARRDLGEDHNTTFNSRMIYARALYEDTGSTLDDLREAVTTLEDAARIGRRVLGSAHPFTLALEEGLRESRAVLRARETPGSA